VLEQLQIYFLANTLHNHMLAQELLRVLHLLKAHGISALPYKGPVLAATFYGDLTLRQFGDLDILVRPQDANSAKALLWAQGYRWQYGRPPALFPRLLRVYELLSPNGQVLVELHWAFTSATFFFPLAPAPLWTRLETISLPGIIRHSISGCGNACGIDFRAFRTWHTARCSLKS
jgi:hypothetical protein